MEAFRARQFAKAGAAPNTFIGGIAKTGGTGVNEPIDTPYKLSQKLGIDVNRISGFKVSGDDVECRIRGSYVVGDNFAQNNTNITNFIDQDGLVTSFMRNAFRGSSVETVEAINVTRIEGLNVTDAGSFYNATKIKNINSNKVYFVGFSAFNGCVELLSFHSDELITVGLAAFNNCRKVVFSNGGNFNKVTSLARSAFGNCREATGYSFNSLVTIGAIEGTVGMFRDNHKATSYNFPSLVTAGTALGIHGFTDNLILTSLSFPELVTLNCATITSNETLGFIRNTPLLTTFSAPKLTTVTGCSFLQEANGLELLDIKKCSTFLDPALATNPVLEVSGLKLNCVINIHENNKTNWTGGTVNAVLQAAKDLRNATVNFYDDNEDYVSTL